MVSRADRYRSRLQSFSCAATQALSLKPLAFSFIDETDRELFATELEFAFRKAPRRLETWGASCTVPVKNRDEAKLVQRVAQKYQAVRASNWACADMTMQPPQQPQPDPGADTPETCSMSIGFRTPQAAQAFAASAMRLPGAKVQVDGTTVKCDCPHDMGPKAIGLASRAMGMGSAPQSPVAVASQRMSTQDSNGKDINEGDRVMIDKAYGGGSGVVESASNGFVVVSIKGKSRSYSSSDVTVKG